METEYLSRVDPLHGNLDLNTETEIIESSSFRKMSRENIEENNPDINNSDEESLKGAKSDQTHEEFLKGGNMCIQGTNGRNLSVLLQTFAEKLVTGVISAAIESLYNENNQPLEGAVDQGSKVDEDHSSSDDDRESTTTEGSYRIISPEIETCVDIVQSGASTKGHLTCPSTSISNESLSSNQCAYEELSALVTSDENMTSDLEATSDLSPLEIKQDLLNDELERRKVKLSDLHPQGSVISDESLSSDILDKDDLSPLEHDLSPLAHDLSPLTVHSTDVMSSKHFKDLNPNDAIISDESLSSDICAEQDLSPLEDTFRAEKQLSPFEDKYLENKTRKNVFGLEPQGSIISDESLSTGTSVSSDFSSPVTTPQTCAMVDNIGRESLSSLQPQDIVISDESLSTDDSSTADLSPLDHRTQELSSLGNQEQELSPINVQKMNNNSSQSILSSSASLDYQLPSTTSVTMATNTANEREGCDDGATQCDVNMVLNIPTNQQSSSEDQQVIFFNPLSSTYTCP